LERGIYAASARSIFSLSPNLSNIALIANVEAA
jgi:hypothetical protein